MKIKFLLMSASVRDIHELDKSTRFKRFYRRNVYLNFERYKICTSSGVIMLLGYKG